MAAPGRRWIFQLHLWSALTVGVVLLVVALTGAMLVFRPELDPVFNQDLFAVAPGGAPQPLDELVATAQRAHPETKVDFVRLPGAADRSVQVALSDKQTLFVNPYTLAVLGQRGRYEGFFGRCEQWHRLLLLGAPGKFIVRACAILTVIVLLTGFYLWLPPVWRVLKSGLTLNFKLRGRAWNFNLHKVAGIYGGGVVLVSALTGLPQSFDWLEHGVYEGWGAAAPPPVLHSTPPAGAAAPGFAPLQLYLAQVQRLLPEARETMIYAPRKPDAAVEVFATGRGAPHANARSYLYLDAYSGAVLRFIPYQEGSRGYRFYFTAVSLHFGQIGGLAGRLVLLGGVLVVPVLAMTGLAMFLVRRRRPPA